MTSGRPGGGRNLWRDVASVVVDQVADRIRSANDSASAKGATSATGQQQDPASRTAAGEPARIGAEIKKLVAQGLAASTETVAEYQSERERRRTEAPMRKAQSRAATARASAVGLAVVGVTLLAGGAGSIAIDEPAFAVPPVVLSIGAGAGAFALSRRGREHQAVADEHARRLGAASASAVSISGVSAYTVTLPNQSSLAYEPTRRLVSQRTALAELLPDVEGIAPELRPLAEESERTLAVYAERIIKLERAQAAAAGSASLDVPLARAVAQYEEGVDAHQKLVEAAATVMAELISPHVPDPAHESISEAADRLRALAEGLREVHSDPPLYRTPGASTSTSRTNTGAASPEPAPRARRTPRERDRRRDLAD